MLKVLGKVQDINTKQPNIASTRIHLYKCGLLNNEEGKQMLNEAKKEFIGPDLIKAFNYILLKIFIRNRVGGQKNDSSVDPTRKPQS